MILVCAILDILDQIALKWIAAHYLAAKMEHAPVQINVHATQGGEDLLRAMFLLVKALAIVFPVLMEYALDQIHALVYLVTQEMTAQNLIAVC